MSVPDLHRGRRSRAVGAARHREPERPLVRLGYLVAFNLGVEAGQLGVVALGLGIACIVRRRKLEVARPRALVCYALGGVGAFWLISRAVAIFSSS